MQSHSMSKRSPSILVTDSRSNQRFRSAPFAGKSQSSGPPQPPQPFRSPKKLHKKRSSQFSDISVDNILSDISDIPSARREQRVSVGSGLVGRTVHGYYTKVPSRTSKTSQKLVLIPDDELNTAPTASTKAERMSKAKRATKLSRVTAYNVSDGFALKLLGKFLRETHDVSTRLYDECLYVPYMLPLLPGKDGFRIKSHINSSLDKLIDSSERRDHLYEYYSGVETPEDANNNYEIDKMEAENNTPFDPSEPQYFAEQQPVIQDPNSKQHAELFIFGYGVVVFWNFTEIQEKNILADLAFASKKLIIRPLEEQDIETEQFHFQYDMETERPRIFNDMITLRSGDHLIKLTMSHAVAQSTKLSRFESRISPILSSVSKLPKRLALYGRLGLKREQLLKKSGKLFKLRVDVNLSSSVLDTPEFFWSFEPSLHPLYSATREYLEIEQRVQVLNDRCKVFLEFVDICADSIAEKKIAKITWWIIVVIFVSLVASLLEILVRYLIINKRG